MAAPAGYRDDGPMTEEITTGPRRLGRCDEGRLITGVCSGLARYTRIDAVVYRVGFALLALATGIGVVLYIAAFLFMAAPDGSPSKIERMGKRLFDGDTVLAVLGAGLAAAMVSRIISDPTSANSVSLVVVFGLAMFVAHSRGVDLVQLARSMPERVKGRPLSSWVPPAPVSPAWHREGMVDLARLGADADADIDIEIDTARPYAPEPAPYQRPPRSYLGSLTVLAAAVTAAILFAATDGRAEFPRIQIVIAGALAAVAAGHLCGAWFGRDRKLTTLGAIMSLALAMTTVGGDPGVAGRINRAVWRPAAVTSPADQNHKVIIGQSVVDLTDTPLTAGGRFQVNAEVMVGVLDVLVPSTARVEVDGQALIGDITVDGQVTGGPGARVRQVLEPEGPTKGGSPTIVLRIRSKIGDMEVTRVPA